MPRPVRLGLLPWTCLVALLPSPSVGEPTCEPAMLRVEQPVLLGEQRVSRSEVEYTYHAKGVNEGVVACPPGVAVVASPTGAVAVDDRLAFAATEPGARVAAVDTFILRHPPEQQPDLEQLQWTFSVGEIGEIVGIALPRAARDDPDRVPLSIELTPRARAPAGLDARDPFASRTACLGLVLECAGQAGQEPDDCARSVPRCQTRQPWEEDLPCCPEACYLQFNAARLAGRVPMAALQESYGANDCYPGIAEHLEICVPAEDNPARRPD